ncbi:WD40-repeat-containing domain protein [Xylariomycetidae sp. FL0641]|nr:WD40-repeat-containing domain protein [Xylariomycetidae sp. FL0641]
MRLRQSNQTKRFGPSDLLGDISDGELPAYARRRRRHDTSDEEDDFIADDAAPDLDGDHDKDLGTNSSTSGAVSGEAPKQPSRKTRKTQAPPVLPPLRPDDEKATNWVEIPSYPNDPNQKWTRSYIGPVKRWTRFQELVDWWFGDRANFRTITNGFTELWWAHELLPPKLYTSAQLSIARKGWMAGDFPDDSSQVFHHWYQKYLETNPNRQTSIVIDRANALHGCFLQAEDEIPILLGPYPKQEEHRLRPGHSVPFSEIGNPIAQSDHNETKTGGWLLDVGGIVVALGWVPINGDSDQLLSLATVPFADEAFHKNLDQAPKESDKKKGSIQVWRFERDRDSSGVPRPARRSPVLAHVMCFSWGRVSRMQWCPVPLSIANRVGLLAVLSGDGKLRVLEVQDTRDRKTVGVFEDIQQPMVTIEAPKECSLCITCFTWLNMNRIAIGLSDGSVAVWSILPRRCLQRHPIHSSPIMDIVSCYPSEPFVVGTVPMGGFSTITDLSRPNAEMSYHPNSVVALQPNMLAWTDQLRGFVMPWPSSYPANMTLTFVHSRVFPASRHLLSVDVPPTSIAVGVCHPFALVGTADGSVWTMNMLLKVVTHRPSGVKMKVFQHEYLATAAERTGVVAENGKINMARGRARILTGFLSERNTHPTSMRGGQTLSANVEKAKKKRNDDLAQGKGKGKDKGRAATPPAVDSVEEVNNLEGEVGGPKDTIIIHEPQTRITALAWNPNVEFSWWAAAAMGSGLVRVMDLGIEGNESPDHRAGARFSDLEESADGFDSDNIGSVDEDAEDESDGDVDMV